ncbi:AI-2E family transporter [Dyella japonica]|uniref:Permease n=1 Tax=Dyella japonica A8 TaxID=1217721 RepID=A0A075K7S0_9GAMM|nr:AI-2E family transporter [Dyella japonica]AIF48188.1 permease [Dyella japonica A8]
MAHDSETLPSLAPQRAIAIVAHATVLALLYFGREVLTPIVLALFLSLLMAPWVRLLRRWGLGHAGSVFVAVLSLAVVITGLVAMVSSQVIHIARDLPRYEATVHSKIHMLRAITVGRIEVMQGEFGDVINPIDGRSATLPRRSDVRSSITVANTATEAPALAKAPSRPMAILTRILFTAWTPLQTAGIVLVVLVFVLLEHESLRDRFIRLVGGSDLRATTAAINDAGRRLSRFFVSTFSVNLGVGIGIWLGLTLIGVPNAPLWAALTATLRFVPYVGVWIVAVVTALFAAAVDSGWSLLLQVLALYLIIETVVSQLVEPFLYGHTTGLSPLAVVVAAIFWSWLWGPIGLVMSTPLTLCLVVTGRNVKALDSISVLLGDTPALTMQQRLYQRALSADADEILDDARAFLKRRSFVAYCDLVLMPALELARSDLARGVISREQQSGVREVIVTVVEMLGSDGRRWTRRQHRTSVLDEMSIGRRLRQQRECISGRWQGPMSVVPHSLVLCVSLGSLADDLAAELLTRILRDMHLDARHLSTDDFAAFDSESRVELAPDAVSMLYIICSDLCTERRIDGLALDLRGRFPEACIVAALLTDSLRQREVQAVVGSDVNEIVNSLEAAARQAVGRLPKSRAVSSQ